MKEKLLDYATGIQHIGIPTLDLQKTKDFYTGLGFTIHHEKCIREGTQNVCFLKFNNLILECYEDETAPGVSGAIDHFAIDVKNIDECFALCKELGYTVVSGDIEELPFYENGVRFFIILGPNSERVEFNEVL